MGAMHVLGIDAGGTKTVCLLADAQGAIVAEGRGPGANLHTAGELAVILDREVTEIEAAIGHIRGRDSDRRRLWATALAIAWLELRAGDAEDEWKLLRRKAEEWIDSVPVRLEGGMTWTAAAKRFLTA